MTLISDILLKMFLTKLDSENIIVMSPSPGINHNGVYIHKAILLNLCEIAPLMISGRRSRL